MAPLAHVGGVPTAQAPHVHALLAFGASTRLVGAAIAKPDGHAALWFGANATSDQPVGITSQPTLPASQGVMVTTRASLSVPISPSPASLGSKDPSSLPE